MTKPENHFQPELTSETISKYALTFINRFDMYPMQLADGKYVSIKKPLDMALVSLHLQGLPTLGAYALDKQSQAKWICFDADKIDQWQGLLAMAQTLEDQGINGYIEQSRRGGHFWLFTPPLSGSNARQFGLQLLRKHQLEGIELFPKQEQLADGPGSFVRLPLGIHRKTGTRYYFTTPKGKPLAPSIREQIQLLTEPVKVPGGFVESVLANIPTVKHSLPTPKFQTLIDSGQGEVLSQRLKSRISVFDFIREYVELDQRGRGYCPFHQDQHRSFGVNQDGNYWHCWAGCGGGSIIDFWMKWREKQGQEADFKSALADLAHMLL